MPKENEDLAGALRHYRELLEQGEYYEAHEVLEEAWHPLRRRGDERRNLAKGLINAAVAFEHLRRNRPKSRRVATQAIAAYRRYRPLCQEGIDEFELFESCCLKVESLCERWEI